MPMSPCRCSPSLTANKDWPKRFARPWTPRFSGLPFCPSPYCASRKAVRFHGLSFHLDTVARSLRRHIARVSDHHRVQEMLVQMIDVLDDAPFHRSGDGDEIEHREMLHVFTQTH